MPVTIIKQNIYVRLYDDESRKNAAKSVSNFYGFNPLKTSNSVPHFHHPVSKILYPKNNKTETKLFNELISSTQIFGQYKKPVVLIFRPVFFNDIAVQRLYLESLQADIQVMGGELITVTNASIRTITSDLYKPNALNILSDEDNVIAGQFGLYNYENPITDWLSGIEGDISLPAYYIISPDGKILHHYIDYNFRTYNYNQTENEHFTRQLLTNVYQVAQKIKEELN